MNLASIHLGFSFSYWHYQKVRLFLPCSSLFSLLAFLGACNSTETGNPLQPTLPSEGLSNADPMAPVTPKPDLDPASDADQEPSDSQAGEDADAATLESFNFSFDSVMVIENGAVGGAQIEMEPQFSLGFRFSSLSLLSCNDDGASQELSLGSLAADEAAELTANTDSICEILIRSVESAEIKNQDTLKVKKLEPSFAWRFRLDKPWSIKEKPGSLRLAPSELLTEEEFDQLTEQESSLVNSADYLKAASTMARIWSLSVPSSAAPITSEELADIPLDELCTFACRGSQDNECDLQSECRSCEINQACADEQRALLQCQASLSFEALECSAEGEAVTKTGVCEQLKAELEVCEGE